MAEAEMDRIILELVVLKDKCDDEVKTQIDKTRKGVRGLQDTIQRLRKERDDLRQQLNAIQAPGPPQQQQQQPPQQPSTPTGPRNSQTHAQQQQQRRPSNASAPPAQNPQRNNSTTSAISPRTSIQVGTPTSRPSPSTSQTGGESPAKRHKPNPASHPNIFTPTRPSPSRATSHQQVSPLPPPPPPRRYVACTICWQLWLASDRRSRHHCSGDTICDYCRARGCRCEYHLCNNGMQCTKSDCSRLHPDQWDQKNDRGRHVRLQ